jgi:hypothetical protein
MSIHAGKRIAGAAALFVAVAAPAPFAAASPTTSPTVKISAELTVTHTKPPSCSGAVCTIKNHGTGTMTPYGNVTFTTTIIADGNQPPCGTGSQWVNRIVRNIHTSSGNLVLDEAGLQCPQPGGGPRVEAVWAVDGRDSTGIFHAATGSGHDVAYPAKNTAAPQGTITLAS